MNLKKTIALSLALLTVLSLSACGIRMPGEASTVETELPEFGEYTGLTKFLEAFTAESVVRIVYRPGTASDPEELYVTAPESVEEILIALNQVGISGATGSSVTDWNPSLTLETEGGAALTMSFEGEWLAATPYNYVLSGMDPVWSLLKANSLAPESDNILTVDEPAAAAEHSAEVEAVDVAEKTTLLPSGNKIVDIAVSDQAKALTATLAESGEAECFAEGSFEQLLPALYAQTGQTFPSVQVVNQHSLFEFEGMQVHTLGSDASKNIVLYIHGGAWVYGIDAVHVTFCDELATRLDAMVYMPLYPLAPQNTADEAYNVIYDLYCGLIAQDKKIYVMGDSAGGNISLGLAHMLKANYQAMPEAMVLMAPAADISFSNPEIYEVEKIDPALRRYGCLECAKLWAAGRALEDPLLNPMYSDVSGYPKTMLIFGTGDILYPDGMKLFEKLDAAGVKASFVRAEGLFHVFPVYPIPERTEILEMITEFCG